ncbi:MAG: S9 family peptidase [Elusimicrobia bacterium]|nr:S9 family peptidase [Elusimicrobiota bacterium]
MPAAVSPAAAAATPAGAAVTAAQALHAAAPRGGENAPLPDGDGRRLDAAFDGVKHPESRRDESVVNDYHGTKVSDPYRWLEDDNSAETKAWVDAQNRVTEKALDAIPERAEIAARLKELWNYERVGTPTKIGGHWIYMANDGLQNQSVMYKARTLKGPRAVLLDPNQLSADGTAALSGTSFSQDGRYLAYAISRAGSDWNEWKIRDVAAGKDLPETLKWTKFTGASWTKDGKGFYYTRYPEAKAGDELTGANENAKVYYHKAGEPQDKDVLVYERPEQPRWSFGAGVTEDGRYLLLYQYEGTEPKNRIWVKDLAKPGADFKPLFDRFDARYSIIGNEGPRFFVQTTNDAPRGRLVAVDLRSPAPENWRTVIPEARDRDVLDSVGRVGKRFVAVWKTDAHEVMRVYGPRGGFKYQVKLPAIGSVSGFEPTTSKEEKKGFFTFSSYNYPRTHFRLNLETGKTSAYWRPKVPVDPSKFEVTQVFYPSKDGTKIPMFIVHKKGLKLDGTNPTYLYGYGGFGVSMTPGFSGANIAWLERGGVYAVANLRGGGEYGQEWHDAGRLDKKQNVFDDFIAAAEFLIKERYTSSPKLAIGGGSNGGLLVGAAMTQRPELFGAAVPEVGVLDMLRFHLFTVGRGWKSDYGSSETKEGFDTLIGYSPLHNVKPGTSYPATMVMTGDHDDRVVPAHSHKFTAALQAAQAGPAPILTRVEKDAGHGAGKPMSKMIQEVADMWAFILKALGVSRPAGLS